MRKNMVSKGLVVGIIVLFVGASVVPSTCDYIRETSKDEYGYHNDRPREV